MNYKYLKTFGGGILLWCLLSPMLTGAQNTPSLVSTAPSGTVSPPIQPPPAIAQGVGIGYNYVREYAPSLRFTNPADINENSPETDVQIKTTFTDGFNRPFQSITRNHTSGTNKHLVELWDTRYTKGKFDFLPMAVASENSTAATPVYISNAFELQKNYYNGLYPDEGYTPYTYEKSVSTGISRAKAIYLQGKSQVGQQRGSIVKKGINVTKEVRIWKIDANGLPVSNSTYLPGMLYVQETQEPKDADNDAYAPTVREYKDKDGRLVLKQVADSSYKKGVLNPIAIPTYQSTYYVYDEMGKQRYVLTAKAMEIISANSWIADQSVLDNLCFQYKYDSKGRMSAQRFPGEEGFTAFVYDKKGRLVMRQTPSEAVSKHYEVTLYDRLDRVTATALYYDLSSREEWQNLFDTHPYGFGSNDIRYYLGFNPEGEGVYPPETGVINITMLTYNYYDDYSKVDPDNTKYYNFNNQLQFSEYLNIPGAEYPVRSMRTHGLATGNKIRVLPSPSANQITTCNWIYGHNYYDDKSRLINSLRLDLTTQGVQVHFDYSGTQYDFLGRPLISKRVFQNLYVSYTVYTELSKNEYESLSGRLSKTSHKVGSAPWDVTGVYKYDDLGRIQRKTLGNYGEVQDYSYNIRGQLNGINGVYAMTGNKEGESRTFGESLKYDFGFTKPRYDGKIAGQIWRGGSGSSRAYGYSYDVAGRLKSAEFRAWETSNWNKNTLDYTLSNLNYDKNGNILSMDQQGVTTTSGIQTIDKLRYDYEEHGASNRLKRVQDDMADYQLGDFVNTNSNNVDYDYDANGNLVLDANKGISNVTYTHFNKPETIAFTNGNKIEYSYDATGRKIQELVMPIGQTAKQIDYIGSFVYQDHSLQYILRADGRTVRTTINNDFKEEYFVKDHLGNVRATIDVIGKPLLQYLATYELASANLEGLLFDQLNEIRDDKPGSTDPGDIKSGRLNGEDQRIGTSLLMHVMAGDQVEMNVNSFYDSYNPDDDNPVDGSAMLQSIVGTLTGGVGGFQGSEGHNPDMVQQLFTPDNYLTEYRNITNGLTDNTRPKAYLNYVLFDENMRINKSFSNAFQVNSNGSWEQIGTASPLTIPDNGYLAVYLSNESRGISCYDCANIHFDQLRIKLQKGRQLEETHYYPFGLPIAGLSSAAENNTLTNRFKYQSNEYIKDLGLNWMSFNARQYDPQLGRFLGVDRLADVEGQEQFSPYAAMGNMPESMIDPDGDIYQITGLSFARATELANDMFGAGNFSLQGDINGKEFIVVINEGAAGAATQHLAQYFARIGMGGAGANAQFMVIQAAEWMMRMVGDPNRSINAIFDKNGHVDMQTKAEGRNVRGFNEWEINTYTSMEHAMNKKIGDLPTWQAIGHARLAAKNGLYIPNAAASFAGSKFGMRWIYARETRTFSEMKLAKNVSSHLSRSLMRLGWGLAAVNAAYINQQYQTNQIGKLEFYSEEISNGLTQAPLLGWAWGAGWEGGRVLTGSSWYIDNLRPYIWGGLDYILGK